VALLAMGYPKEKFDMQGKILHLIRRRKPLEKIISLEEFGNKPKNSEHLKGKLEKPPCK
jgi:hypothetical protein